jgi:hypothetical protein
MSIVSMIPSNLFASAQDTNLLQEVLQYHQVDPQAPLRKCPEGFKTCTCEYIGVCGKQANVHRQERYIRFFGYTLSTPTTFTARESAFNSPF